MFGSATLSQPKIDTLRAVLGHYVGRELDAKTQAAVASELSAKLGTKVSANEIPSLIRGYAAVASRVDAQDGHQAQVSSSVGRTLTASSTRDDHRSRWNPRGVFAVQLAQVSSMVVGAETLVSAVMRNARTSIADLASAALANSATAAKRGLAAAMILGVIGGGVQSAAFAQELGTAALRTQHQAVQMVSLEQVARELKADQKVYVVGNVQRHNLDQLEDYLRANAPNVTVVAVERADRTRDQLDNFVHTQLAAAPAVKHRFDATTKQGNGMVILISFGNKANASERSLHFWSNDFYAARKIRVTADISQAFRAPGADATVDARVRSVVEHAQRVTGSAAPQSTQSVSSIDLDTTTMVGGGIGLLVAGLGIAAGLGALRRRRVGKEAREKIAEVEKRVSERLTELKQVISDVQSNLGDSPKAVLNRFSDRTLEIAQAMVNDLAELTRMHGAMKVIQDEAKTFLAADGVSSAATRFMSSGNLQNALSTVTDRAVSFASGLPNVIDESVGSPAWREAVAQDLKASPAFTASANKLLADIEAASGRAAKASATIISAMSSDVKLFDLKTEHDALTKLVQKVSTNAKADGLFTFDLAEISAAVDKSIAAARSQFRRDPVGAFERGGETANRILDESALLANTCVSAREELLPIIASSKETLAKNGVATGWLDDAVRAISDDVTRQASTLDDGSGKAGIDKIVTDIRALTARAQDAVELDARRTGPAPETLASARKLIADTRAQLAQQLAKLNVPTSGLLLEAEYNPTAHADAADVALVQCKEHLDAGSTSGAGQALARFDKEIATADELLQEATHSVANHAANRESLRQTGRELDRAVDEHLEFMPRLRRQYAESVLTKLDGVEHDVTDAMFAAKDALQSADHLFPRGAVIGAGRAIKAADEAFSSIGGKLDAIREVTAALENADQNNATNLRRVEHDYNALARRASGLTLLETTIATVQAALAAVERSSAALGASYRDPYDVASMVESARLAVASADSAVSIEVANRQRATEAITNARVAIESAQKFSKGGYAASRYGDCGASDYAAAVAMMEAGNFVQAAEAAGRALSEAESNVRSAESAADDAVRTATVTAAVVVGGSSRSDDNEVASAPAEVEDTTPTVSNETF